MAIYPYRCEACGRQEEVFQSISSYSVSPQVPQCHGPMVRLITAPLVSFDTAPWAAYQSPIDGTVIDSRTKRNEHMARHGVVMYEEVAPDIERNKIARQKAAVADIKGDIVEAVQMLESGVAPPPKISEAEIIPA